jgi:hypothetical protein
MHKYITEKKNIYTISLNLLSNLTNEILQINLYFLGENIIKKNLTSVYTSIYTMDKEN